MLVIEGNNIEQTVLDRLKTATKALHARIDANLPLAARDADRDAYHGHLQLLQVWLASVAPAIADGRDSLADFAAASNRASLELLQQDLRSAGLALRPPAPPDDHPGMDRAAFRWGVQYVIEGSYMGAAVLHKRLAPQWPDCPMLFFGHVGAGGRARWAGFADRIERAVAGAAAIADAERGAIHAFGRFIDLSEDTQPSLSPLESA